MKWRRFNSLWILLLLLLPVAAAAEVTQAVIAVDGMSCPFCAFGVEKKLKTVSGTDKVAVSMREGTATLVAEAGKSLDIGQIGRSVRAAGFTPGLLRITVVGTVKEDNENLLLDVRHSTLSIQLVRLSPQLKQQLLDLVKSGAAVSLSGTLSEAQADRPRLRPETVMEVRP